MSERGQEELRELANKYNAAVNEIKELTDKIKVRAQAKRCYSVYQMILFPCQNIRLPYVNFS